MLSWLARRLGWEDRPQGDPMLHTEGEDDEDADDGGAEEDEAGEAGAGEESDGEAWASNREIAVRLSSREAYPGVPLTARVRVLHPDVVQVRHAWCGGREGDAAHVVPEEDAEFVTVTSTAVMRDGSRGEPLTVGLPGVPVRPLPPQEAYAAPERAWRPADVGDVEGDVLTICSYNVLAPLFTTPGAYVREPTTPEWSLAWPWRGASLVREVETYAADVLCMQEVQSDQFGDFWQPELAKIGFPDGHYMAKSNVVGDDSLGDGVAVFLCEGIDVERVERVAYEQLVAERWKRDHANWYHHYKRNHNVALLVLCRHRDSGKAFLVANTHLFWNPTYPEVKLLQASLLLQQVHEHFPEVGHGIPLVLCGDLNSLPNSDVYRLLSKGKVHASNVRGREKGALRKSDLQSPIGALRSCYAQASGSRAEPEFTNFPRKFCGTLDYIFVGGGGIEPVRVRALPSRAWIKQNGHLPNRHLGSDHLALVADVALT